MPDRNWALDGSDLVLDWGGRAWRLATLDGTPGLWVAGGGRSVGPLLGLAGFAKAGRSLTGVFASADETSRAGDARVGLTYRVGELTVRAGWKVEGDDAVDLEVEVSLAGDAPGPLDGFELLTTSILPEPGGSRTRRWVEPRDAHSAGLSYDGRDADLSDLTTLPVPTSDFVPLAPRVVPGPWEDGFWYVELARPGEVARRVSESRKVSSVGHTTWYGLFGRTLMPGASVSARLRGLWLLSTAPQRDALELAERFAREAPGD